MRFTMVINGAWDHHNKLKSGLTSLCRRTDKPIAGLLADLEQRGLLDSTLVVWGGEFGRLPTVENADGRDHNPYGFTMWMAGGGVRGGTTFGATDEFGYAATAGRVTHSHVHATVMRLLGLDHQKVSFTYEGRAETLVGVNPAQPIEEIIAT